MKFSDFYNQKIEKKTSIVKADIRIQSLIEEIKDLKNNLVDLWGRVDIPNSDLTSRIFDIEKKFNSIEKETKLISNGLNKVNFDSHKYFGDFELRFSETLENFESLAEKINRSFSVFVTKQDLEQLNLKIDSKAVDLSYIEELKKEYNSLKESIESILLSTGTMEKSTAALKQRTEDNRLSSDEKFKLMDDLLQDSNYQLKTELDSSIEINKLNLEHFEKVTKQALEKLNLKINSQVDDLNLQMKDSIFQLKTELESLVEKINKSLSENFVDEKIRLLENRIDLVDQVAYEKIETDLIGMPIKSIGGNRTPFFRVEEKR